MSSVACRQPRDCLYKKWEHMCNLRCVIWGRQPGVVIARSNWSKVETTSAFSNALFTFTLRLKPRGQDSGQRTLRLGNLDARGKSVTGEDCLLSLWQRRMPDGFTHTPKHRSRKSLRIDVVFVPRRRWWSKMSAAAVVVGVVCVFLVQMQEAAGT